MIRGSFHTIIGTGHRTFPEKSPLKPQLPNGIQIIGMQKDSLFRPSGIRKQFPGFIRQKRRTIKGQGRGLSAIFLGRIYPLLSNPVCCNDRHHICRRMPLHTAPPVRHTVTLNNRLGAYRRRIKQKLRSLQRHTPCCFREPLVPADSHTNFCIQRIPYPKARISRRKIKFLLIKMVIRDMGFPIYPQNPSIPVYHCHGIIGHIFLPLKKAHRQHHPALRRHLFQPLYRGVFLQRICQLIGGIISLLTKIPGFKQLRQKHYLRTLPGCLSDKLLRLFYILLSRPIAVHLHCRHGYIPHDTSTFLPGICWVIQ